jgi:methionyl-tRNA formyltransferase
MYCVVCRCRAFAEWPGVWTHITRTSESPRGNNNSNDRVSLRVKIVTTAVLRDGNSPDSNINSTIGDHSDREIKYVGGCGIDAAAVHTSSYFEVVCGDGSRLAVYELQPTGKKVMSARAFHNGLKDRKLYWDV